MAYLDENFLLHSPTARRLFHEVAKNQPIIDYHCHLSPREIATNHRWANLAEIWLGGDHYKWRLLRANGVAEEVVTGNSTPREKFQAWAETVPFTLRNPVHHWTHLELQRYFGIDLLLGPDTADEIWERANAKLAEPEFSTHGVLKKCDVRVVGTTDDPADPLDDHAAIAASALTGAFQDGTFPGKIQFGSGWWFLDQKNGIELQLDALSATGLLSRFVGMITDSRSFLSFPRHEYFRRILCNLIGSEADRGELPDHFDALANLIRAVCFGNAKRHFGFDV